MFFVNKQKKVEEQLSLYRQSVSECYQGFLEAVMEYFRSNDRVQLAENYQKIHKLESRADDIRREISVMMYSKSIFPESRGDILGLLEAMDKVPNQTESTLEMILTHYIEIPKELQSMVGELLRISGLCVKALMEAAEKLFSDFVSANIAIGKVDQLESDADIIEMELIEKIFGSEKFGDVQKLLLRDVVVNIAGITDKAENAGDCIRIIAAKRMI